LDIEFASCTDVGLRRSHNQDSHVALPAADTEQWRQRGHVFLVADGMGAHAVGELASKWPSIASRTFIPSMPRMVPSAL